MLHGPEISPPCTAHIMKLLATSLLRPSVASCSLGPDIPINILLSDLSHAVSALVVRGHSYNLMIKTIRWQRRLRCGP
jgi:hypothetical protein